jgi:hypothetical protein
MDHRVPLSVKLQMPRCLRQDIMEIVFHDPLAVECLKSIPALLAQGDDQGDT